MENNYFAAVDLGAMSGRVMLGKHNENGIDLEEILRFPNHLIQVGKHYHWDIFELYRNVIEGLKILSTKKIQITSIGIDTWGCDFVCVGKDGGLMRQPYAYRDPHTVGASLKFFNENDREKVYETTGIQVMDFNTLFQFYTLRKNHDDAFESACKLLFMPDALSYMLTGEMVCEYSIATTAQIVNAKTKRLSSEILETVVLTEDNFGRFIYPGEKIGKLTAEVQRQTGLGPVPVVAVAGHDTGSAVAAVPTKTDHFAYLSSGTWSLMGIESPTPIINSEAARMNYTNEGGVAGTIRFLKNICGMWLLERCREKWPNVSYPQLIAEANDSEAFRSLIFPDAPEFANPEDMEKAIMSFCEKTNQPVPTTRGQLVRCIFESLALRYRQVLENLEILGGSKIEVLHIIGGGSKNELLNQWTANSIGREVVAGPSEATAIGNIMMQIVAVDNSSQDCSSIIKKLRNIFAQSTDLKIFTPQEKEIWNKAYNKFNGII